MSARWRGPAKLAAGIVPALAILVLAVWEVFATLAVPARVATDADWAAAEAEVRAGFQAGDLIVFAPRWVDPVGRLHLGDLIPVDVAGRMDAARFARIWEVSIRGARAADARGARVTSSRSHGGVHVRLLEQTPARVRTDFVAAFAAARSSGASAGAGPILEEVGFQPHRCIRIEPPAGGSGKLTWPAAELGSKLVGHVGLADVFTRRAIRGPGKLELLIGGKSVATTVVGVDSGWVRFEVATTPGPAEVTFIASAKDPRRLICFAAEARE